MAVLFQSRLQLQICLIWFRRVALTVALRQWRNGLYFIFYFFYFLGGDLQKADLHLRGGGGGARGRHRNEGCTIKSQIGGPIINSLREHGLLDENDDSQVPLVGLLYLF